MAVEIETSPALTIEETREVFQGRYFTGGPQRPAQYDIASERRFLMIKAGEETSAEDPSAPTELIPDFPYRKVNIRWRIFVSPCE